MLRMERLLTRTRLLVPRVTLGVLLVATWSAPAQAAVPTATAMEGALFSSGGGPAADGAYNVTFNLYKDANSAAPTWSEGPVVVTVKGGLFAYVLGSTKPLDGPAAAALGATPFMGVKIEADPELPRKAIGSVLFATRAGTAEAVDCSGCIAASALDAAVLKPFAKTADLSKSATSGSYADLTGKPDLSVYAQAGSLAAVATSGKYADLAGTPDLTGYAKTAGLAGVALTGAYADLAGAPVLAKVATTGAYGDLLNSPVPVKMGDKCGTGLVLRGIKADGTYDCVASFDAANVPPDLLNEVSNNLLTNQFDDVFASATVPLDIKDNFPAGVSDSISVPDLGINQGLSISVDIVNSDISTLQVLLVDPNLTQYVLYDKSGKKGDALKTTFPTPTAVAKGDLATWLGKSPKGKWTLTIIDTGFLNNGLDGKLNGWSVNVKNMSSTKVAANGVFQFKVAQSAPVACTPANFGSAYANNKDNALYICNGKDFYPISLVPIGTAANPGFSCKDILAKAPVSGDGVYWVTGTGGVAFQAYCDMTTDGGGWTLVLNLDTSDGAARHYDDTTFWTAAGTVGAPDTWANGDFKSKAFESVGGSGFMMRLHNGGKFKAFSTYNLLANYSGQTLMWLFNNLTNTTVSGPRVSHSGSVGSAGYERNAGDVFADQVHPLIINSTYQPVDAVNQTRLGTNYGDQCATINCNGHNYGGWGGKHYRAGWATLYEGAALNGYCSTQGGFGNNSATFGGYNDAFNGCTPKYQDVDLAVFVR